MGLINTLLPATDGYLCVGFMPQAVAASGYLCAVMITDTGRVGTGSKRFITSGNERHAQLRQEDDDVVAIIIAAMISGDMQ